MISQKELNLMCKTEEKTKNPFFFIAGQKSTKLNTQNELIVDFGGFILKSDWSIWTRWQHNPPLEGKVYIVANL